MANILVDFDQTMSNTQDSMLTLANKKFGTNYTSESITSWATENHVLPEVAEFLWGEECFLSPEVQAACIPVLGAVDGLHALAKAGHGVMIVSDRPESLFDVTRAWLDQHGFAFVRLLFTRSIHSMNKEGKGLTKAQAAYLYKLNVVIEDAPHHAITFSEKDYIDKVYLLDMPYNRHVRHNKVVRVDSWNTIVQELATCV